MILGILATEPSNSRIMLSMNYSFEQIMAVVMVMVASKLRAGKVTADRL